MLLVAGAGLTACTAPEGSPGPVAAPSAAAPSVVTSLLPPAPPRQPGELTLPVLEDDGYADAVATFGGADQVYAAVAADARIACIALADCHRWTTGELHSDLVALVTPSWVSDNWLGHGGRVLNVHVDRTGAVPALVVTGSFAMEVTLGDSEVSAGQDWVLTSVPTAAGWQLADAESNGHVNWAPALP